MNLPGKRAGLRYEIMSALLTAQDLWPLIQKLPHDEQVRMAKLALAAAARAPGAEDQTYREAPPRTDEFSSDEDALAWEAAGWAGWEKVDAPW